MVGAVRCLCKAGGCAVLGSEIMAARFHQQILHLCGFLFLLLRTLFFFSLHFFCCRGKFQPFQPFGSKLYTGIQLNMNSQKGSALVMCEMLICWRVSSAPIFEPFLLLLCNPPGRCLPTPNNFPRLFSLSKITSELSISEKLL